MTSPFPGMDPYLERHWPDVHSALVMSARGVLNELLPPDLVARVEERIAVESEEDEPDRWTPDVRVIEAVERITEQAETRGAAALAPYRLVATIEPLTERFIKIIDTSANRLITVIEVLSPANKRGRGLEAFRNKRSELVAGGVHFVEIDLVRAGNWVAMLRPHVCPKKARTTYRATVRLATDPEAVYLYPISLRERLPVLPIPLREGDPRVEIDLQALVETGYRSGRYGTTLDYRQPCSPPLEEEDAAWAEEVLKAAGKR